MLSEFDFDKVYNPYNISSSSELGEQLARLQRQVKNLDIPVLIIVEGWESSGKGHMIKELIRELDPRSFKVSAFENPTDEEKSRPFLWRFWNRIPRRGNLAIFDRSFYYKLMNELNIAHHELRREVEDIGSIEQQLADDGTIIIKFFLHLKEKTQKNRIERLKNDKYRSFFVTDRDEEQNRQYEDYRQHFDRVLQLSNLPSSPWNIVSTEDQETAGKLILGLTAELIQQGMARIQHQTEAETAPARNYRITEQPLDKVDLTLSLSEEDYKDKLKKLQEEAQDIAYEFYTRHIPCVLVFEGMDAAGKGGAIQRLTRLIDPRSYEVVPISAPDETEGQYHYLWRFYRSMPRKGNITIFDRSWYGRVLVERIEGFARAERWEAAYDEINQMERHLYNSGAMVLKFFLVIDKEEQLQRFKDREAEADKLYKITPEDWRNREKWDSYLEAMNEMLVRTCTEHAPWVIISGQDKKYARIRVLQEFNQHARKIIHSQD